MRTADSMLQFKYSDVPMLKILLKREPYDTPKIPEGVEITRTAIVNGRVFTHDEIVAAVRRTPSGRIEFAPDAAVAQV